MMTLFYIILASFLISAISLIGVITFFFKEKLLKSITIPLVAFSAGALVSGAFLHLIPEAIEDSENTTSIMLWVIFGFSLFFIFEQFIQWHHCHRMPSEHKHPVTYLILLSDGLHNLMDGLAVGAAFLVNPGLGVITSLAVAAHEIPQELGDFGILVHGGWEKTKALLFNFLSGLTMVVGGIIVWALARDLDVSFLLPIAAGNFIYIAASDLVPEIKHCDQVKRNLVHFLFVYPFFIFFFYIFLGFFFGHAYIVTEFIVKSAFAITKIHVHPAKIILYVSSLKYINLLCVFIFAP
jgi:zinc and cadmium transporter